MFYDKQSNNQVLRMQTMHTGMPIVNEAEELKWVVAMFGMFPMFNAPCVLQTIYWDWICCCTRATTFYVHHSQTRANFSRWRCLVTSKMSNSRWRTRISVRPLAAYFIMNNRIYQSPDLYTVVSNRLVSNFETSELRMNLTIRTAYITLLTPIILGHATSL